MCLDRPAQISYNVAFLCQQGLAGCSQGWRLVQEPTARPTANSSTAAAPAHTDWTNCSERLFSSLC